MRWTCTRFPLFILLWCCFSAVYGQDGSAVVEARILSILPGPIYTIQIDKVVNGVINSETLKVSLREDKPELAAGLRRFHDQKWQFTLVEQAGTFQIRAAHGLGRDEPQVNPNPSLPEPIIISPEFLEKIHHKEDHARNLNIGAKEQEIVELTNQARWDNGMLPPLKQNTLLHTSSDCHSERMAVADFFAHCDLYTNKSPFVRMMDAGYNYNSAAENIAAGFSDAWNTMHNTQWGWMYSSGHRANILSTSYREIGVGYHYGNDPGADYFDNGACNPGSYGGPYYHYWTQNFGRRNSVYPVVIERELAETATQSVDLYVYGPGNATSMRFRNENGAWSGWVNYTPDYTWTLSGGNGTKTVHSQVSTGANGSGTVYNASDQIQLNGNCNTMVFSNTTLNVNQTYTDCEIMADPNVTISAQIIFNASTVTLGNNVTIPLGATLDINIQ